MNLVDLEENESDPLQTADSFSVEQHFRIGECTLYSVIIDGTSIYKKYEMYQLLIYFPIILLSYMSYNSKFQNISRTRSKQLDAIMIWFLFSKI